MPTFVRGARVRPKTHGRWLRTDGSAEHLLSGQQDGHYVQVDQHAVTLGLIPAGAHLARSGDVELKVAIRMRQTWERTGATQHETIVINHPDGPCRGTLSCDGLLDRYLPPGSTLTVHWPGGNQKTYRGG